MNIGIGLIVFGLTLRGGLKMYRYIRRRQFIDPFTMYPGGFYAKMNRRQAQLILGIKDGATKEMIKQRHRTLMITNHPDNGGSTFLAAKINEAKQTLINQQ